jgi:hypothetical protein
MIRPFTTAFSPATWRRQSMRQRNHPCGLAGREDRRLDRSKPPRLHFSFIASVSIIGLACKPRSSFQLCEIMGVRLPAKAWSKASAARPRKASTDLKDVPWRQPARDNPGCHGSRSTSNVKGRLVCKELIAAAPNGDKPGYSICCAGTVPPLARAAPRLLMRWLGPGASSNNPPRTGIAPALRGRPNFAASPSRRLSRPSRIP